MLFCINKLRFKTSSSGNSLTWLVDALKKMLGALSYFTLIVRPAGIDAGLVLAVAPAYAAILVTSLHLTSASRMRVE